MAATKRERLNAIISRLGLAGPFRDGEHAFLALDGIVKAVEDEQSGIRENPDSAQTRTSDGRIYPPDRRFERASDCPSVQLFVQLRHQTFIGRNGSIRIVRSDGTVEIDLAGLDNRTVADLFREHEHEQH